MEKFEFLIGDWNLEYKIPKSSFSEAKTGSAFGTIKRALDDKYVFFDYESHIEGETGGAHGIFAWDEKTQIYRYWWFESSGAFMTASCNFTDENTLFMIWHNSLLIQTFKKVNKNKIILSMKSAASENKFDLILEVILTRK
jgi:hypothetical protein